MHPHGPHGNFYIHDARETIYPRITARKGRRKAAEVPKSAIREEYKQQQPNTEETKKTPSGSPRVHLKFYWNFIWETVQSCAMQSLHTRRPCYRDDRRCAPVPAQDYW